MDTSVELIILDRLKEIDAKLDSMQTKLVTVQTELVQRVSICETKLDDVVGDQQPGRLTTVEEKVTKLQNWKYYVLGIAACISVIVGIAGNLILRK